MRAVGARRVAAVDSRVDEIDGLAGIVDQIFPGGAAQEVRLVPHPVGAGVLHSLRALQHGALGERLGVGAQPRRDLGDRHVHGRGVVQLEQDRPQHDRRGERAGEDRDLLQPRRGSDQKAGLQILRRGAGVARGDADDGADRESGDVVGAAGPAHQEKDQAGEEQRRHRHPRNGIARRTDLPGQLRGDRGEQEPEHEDQQRAEQVHVQGRGEHDDDDDREAADQHPLHRDVPIGAPARGRAAAVSLEASAQAAPDHGQRSREAHHAARRHRARADVEHVGAADLVGAHVVDQLRPRRERSLQRVAEELDERDEQQVGEHPARAHDGGDARADDVAHAEQLGGNLRAHRAAF